MRSLIATCVTLTLALTAVVAQAQQGVEIERRRPPAEKEARIVPPPLHHETTRPPDANAYPRGMQVEHDPAFIEPFAGSYANEKGSGRFGLSGWTAPNPPIGSEATGWRERTGWFALGFSVTWDGPPARVAPSQRPAPR